MAKLNRDDLITIVKQATSWNDLRKLLGYKTSGGVHKFLKNKIQKMGIDTSHFTGQGWAKGKNKFNHESLIAQATKLETPWEEAFKIGSDVKNSSLLKRLILSGIKEYKCEVCGLSSWNNKPIRLHLDHINGDNTDAREENLRILCPNCHSQTNTYSRGLKKNVDGDHVNIWWKRLSMGKDIVKNTPHSYKKEGHSNKPKSFCACGNLKKKCSKTCIVCEYKSRLGREIKHRRRFEVTKEDLEKMVWEMPTSKVAQIFGVSDKAIEKRCKKLGINKPERGYWAKMAIKQIDVTPG